ncbi:MAG: immunity 49 family protein [[Pasteurella] aerogenes]|nr:immunity 49 family protein [[Pasteurella] aerogenes]
MKNTFFPQFISCSKGTSLEQSIAFTRSVDEYFFGSNGEENKILKLINKGEGDMFFAISQLINAYNAKASLSLLDNYDVPSFKKYLYISGKLTLLSKDKLQWAYYGVNVMHFFSILMSDNLDLLNYLVSHRDEIVDIHEPYNRKDLREFFNANTLLAISGEFDLLKERALLFLNDEKKTKSDKIRIPDHNFYVALADKNIEDMRLALSILLEPKYSRRAAYDTEVHFDFYLQLQVLMYAKIAMRHGFDLKINSPIAPSELIEISSMNIYDDPYEFMQGFDYYKPYEEWIGFCLEKMNKINKEKEKEPFSFKRWFNIK